MLHRIQPVRDDLGDVIRWFGSSLEIEESRRAHEAMRNTERELRTILETIPAFVWTARPDGALDFITESWFERMGHTRGQILGREWSNMIHPEDRERLLVRWRESIAQGCPLDAEMRGCDANGKYRWLLTRAVPLRDEAGEIIRWYGTLTDIDDRKRAEHELHDLKEQLSQGEHRAARRDQPDLDVRGDRRLVGAAAPRPGARRKGGEHGFDGADHRRDRHRKGADRTRHPQAIAARLTAVRVASTAAPFRRR